MINFAIFLRSSSKSSQFLVKIYNFLLKCANQIKFSQKLHLFSSFNLDWLSQSNSFLRLHLIPVRLHLTASFNFNWCMLTGSCGYFEEIVKNIVELIK